MLLCWNRCAWPGKSLWRFKVLSKPLLLRGPRPSQAIGGTAQDLITAASEMATAAASLGEMERVATTLPQQASGQMAVVVPEMTRAAEAHSQGRECPSLQRRPRLIKRGLVTWLLASSLQPCAQALNALYEQAAERIAIGVDSAIAEPLATASAGLVQAVELMDARLFTWQSERDHGRVCDHSNSSTIGGGLPTALPLVAGEHVRAKR